MRILQKLFTVLLTFGAVAFACAAEPERRVILMVWDGMRPDFVTEKTAPTLFKMAQEGVTFRHHHPVYVSSTEVNGTALATGVYPEVSDVVGNNEFRPAINPTNRFLTADRKAVLKGDELSGGHFLQATTLAETLHSRGLRTAVAGAKPVTFLHDRTAGGGSGLGTDLFEGTVQPESLARELAAALGAFPTGNNPKTNRDLWTTSALLGPMWKDSPPSFSVLWMSEPDFAQHDSGPGSAKALAAIKSSDDNLARVLAALDRLKLRDTTDVIVVSDHGFSTVGENVDIAGALNKHGFHAFRSFQAGGGHAGDIMAVANGGTSFLYVTGHDRGLITNVVHFLQSQPYCAVVMTKTPVEGAFTLEDVRIQSADAPDIVVALRWKTNPSANGTPGMLTIDAKDYRPGQGSHGSLSPYDLHNTCIAAGPDFKKGMNDELPSGNIDIVPTILAVLGVEPAGRLSGRVLRETLVRTSGSVPTMTPHRLDASYRGADFTWHQYLNYSEVEGVIYLDEGSGEQQPLRK